MDARGLTDPRRTAHHCRVDAGVTRRTLAELLADAEARIERYAPDEAYAALQDGAFLVDIRADGNREQDGVVPGALHIPRTVLEWRVAPDSDFRNPVFDDLDRRVILICDHGYSSVLAAAVLGELGYTRAGDVIGGFLEWRSSGLPVAAAGIRSDPPGMGSPDP